MGGMAVLDRVVSLLGLLRLRARIEVRTLTIQHRWLDVEVQSRSPEKDVLRREVPGRVWDRRSGEPKLLTFDVLPLHRSGLALPSFEWVRFRLRMRGRTRVDLTKVDLLRLRPETERGARRNVYLLEQDDGRLVPVGRIRAAIGAGVRAAREGKIRIR